jgi:acyl-CoA reductase-like NAD-dependent aldehyde dehydrogenase
MAKSYKMYLGGQWVERKEKLDVANPFDNVLVGRVAMASREDFSKAIELADKAFVHTRDLPSYKREQACKQIADSIEQKQEVLARTMAREVGKALKDARGEVARAAQVFRISAEEAKRIGGEIVDLDWSPGTDGRMGLVRRFPIGVVAGITPFNFPLNLLAHKIGPAIASGNTIVLKPASKTPVIALLLAELIDQTDLPKGAVSILPGSGEAAAPLLEDERIKLITFTGSDTVGWWIKEHSGKKRVVLELGGNAGAVVADDADLDYATDRLVFGSFGHSGQSCISVQRILVQEKVIDKFLKLFVAKTRKLKVGDPLDPTTDVGTMVSRQAVDNTEQVVAAAVKGGAKILTGGKKNGAIYQPTILTNVSRLMAVCATEVFAPVVTVSAYRTFAEAVDTVNDSVFGLQAGVFTNRMDDVFYAFKRIDVGGVVVNDIPTFRADHQPYGGVKNSGTGREGIRYAIEDMTEIKILSMNLRP